MKEIIKAHYKDILLVLGYIIVAEMIYITLVDDLWHLWYINLLVGVGIFIIGIIFAIALLATSNSSRYETQDLIIQNKGYIDVSTVNTKWIDEYGHEFYVNNYDGNQKTFELDGKKYKIK